MESNFAKTEIAKALIFTLVAAKVKWVRYVFVDLSNQVRSLILSVDEMQDNPEMLLDGVLIPEFVNRVPCFGDVIACGTSAEAVLVLPDLRTLHVLPYDSSHAAFYGSLLSSPSRVSEHCPRSFLKNALKLAEKESVFLNVGVEIEFMLFKGVDEVDETHFCSDRGLSMRSTFMSEVTDMLKSQVNVCGKVYKCHSEVANGQFELVIKHTSDVMKIADSVVATRQTLHAVAEKHGYTAIFLPKPFSGKAGNGLHFHFSFSNSEGGTNDFPGTGKYGLSSRGENFVMGLVTHLPGLVALTQPLDQSYERMSKGNFSGYSQCWGVEDLECSVRVCRDFYSQKLTNVEYKTCDLASNPYIALGAIITAGVDGIKSKMEICEPADPDSCQLLPTSLDKALQELGKNEVLVQALGDKMYHTYLAIKKSEINHYAQYGSVVENFI